MCSLTKSWEHVERKTDFFQIFSKCEYFCQNGRNLERIFLFLKLPIIGKHNTNPATELYFLLCSIHFWTRYKSIEIGLHGLLYTNPPLHRWTKEIHFLNLLGLCQCFTPKSKALFYPHTIIFLPCMALILSLFDPRFFQTSSPCPHKKGSD